MVILKLKLQSCKILRSLILFIVNHDNITAYKFMKSNKSLPTEILAILPQKKKIAKKLEFCTRKTTRNSKKSWASYFRLTKKIVNHFKQDIVIPQSYIWPKTIIQCELRLELKWPLSIDRQNILQRWMWNKKNLTKLHETMLETCGSAKLENKF